jgi:hypothetical protein
MRECEKLRKARAQEPYDGRLGRHEVKREGVMRDGLYAMLDGGRTPLNFFPNEWTRIFSSFGSEEQRKLQCSPPSALVMHDLSNPGPKWFPKKQILF